MTEKEHSFKNLRSIMQANVGALLDEYLSNKCYNVNDAQSWSNQICDKTLKTLTALTRNFKIIANCVIIQKSDCGINLSASCFWDNEADGNITIKWDSDSLICIVNVFACLT